MNNIRSDAEYIALENDYKNCQAKAQAISSKISRLNRQVANVRGDRSGKYTKRIEVWKDKTWHRLQHFP